MGAGSKFRLSWGNQKEHKLKTAYKDLLGIARGLWSRCSVQRYPMQRVHGRGWPVGQCGFRAGVSGLKPRVPPSPACDWVTTAIPGKHRLFFLHEEKQEESKQLYSRQVLSFRSLLAQVVVISMDWESQMSSHTCFLCVCAHTHTQPISQNFTNILYSG